MTDPFEVLRECERQLRRRYVVPRPLREVYEDLGLRLNECSPAQVKEQFSRLVSQPVRQIKPDDFEKLLGFYVPSKAPLVVLRRGLDTDPRIRFTAAHELGHFLIHKVGNQLPVIRQLTDHKNDPSYREHERACNWFAGQFLAPTNEVARSAGPKGKRWLRILDPVSKEFQVSASVIASALTDVTSGEIVFLFLSREPSSGMHALRVRDSSTRRFTGTALGNQAKLQTYHLGLQALPSPGSEIRTELSENIGSLPTAGCPALTLGTPAGAWCMIRLRSPLAC